jgi:hypothetical protein
LPLLKSSTEIGEFTQSFQKRSSSLIERVEIRLLALNRLEKTLVDPNLPLNSKNVHWGYFSKELGPVLNVTSGQEVVVEMATHHACDDWDRMIAGDKGKMKFNGVVWMEVYVVRH